MLDQGSPNRIHADVLKLGIDPLFAAKNVIKRFVLPNAAPPPEQSIDSVCRFTLHFLKDLV